MKLTAKQQAFVDEYLIDLNATQAAIRAGYAPAYADRQGYQQLENPRVAAAIEKAKAERSKRTQIDADWLLKRLAEEAVADIGDLYHEGTGALKPVHQWPKIWRQGLVSGVEVDQQYSYVDGDKVPEGVVTKIRLSDRVKRLELIGKHVSVQAFREQVGVSNPNGDPISITVKFVDSNPDT